MAEQRRTSTGARSLDALLGGGLQRGAVTLVYGEPAAGKTTLALCAAAGLLRSDPAARVVYMDADGKFSLPRLTEIAGEDAPRLLPRLLFSKLTGFEEQAEAVEGLAARVEPGDLAVLDSVTGLYRVETGDAAKTFAENKELNRQLGFLKEVALTRRATLLVTGQVRSVMDSPVPQTEPVAQRLLRFWSDAVLRLDHTPGQGLRRATLEKPAGRRGSCWIRITGRGLADEEERRW